MSKKVLLKEIKHIAEEVGLYGGTIQIEKGIDKIVVKVHGEAGC